MVFSKHIIAGLAAATSAYAASCSSSNAIAIQNQGDVDAISSCGTYKGDININAQSGATLDFGSLKTITGKLSMDSDSLISSLSLNSLTDLGSLSLTNLTALATLKIGSLTNVGDLTLKNLAALYSYDFGSDLETAGTVTLENVQISDLAGIGSATKIGAIIVSNCQFLSTIMFGVNQVGIVDIGANNFQQGQQVTFPNLQTATSLTIRNSTVVSTPMLRNVSQTLGLYGNTFQSYGASNLTWVGALVLEDNGKVTNFSFPALTTINGTNSTLDIENNTALATINGFPKLTAITTGPLILAGNIQNVSLPQLKNIAGAVTVDTTSSSFDCDSIQALKDNQYAKGDLNCKSGDATPTGSNGASSTGGSDSSSSSGAASGLELPTFLTTGVFAALLAFLA